MASKDKKVKLFLGIGLIALALWIGVGAMENFLVPYKLVSEITAQPSEYLNRNIRVVGIIEQDSWRMTDTAGIYEFRITDGDATLNVVYRGDAPGTLNPDAKITAFGVLISEDTIRANKLAIKCPSKYEQKLEDAYEQQKKT